MAYPATPLQGGITLSVMAESVLADMSVSYMSLMWAEISRKLIPFPYMLIILCSRLSARIVSRFLTIYGSNVDDRSRGVSISIVPSAVLSRLGAAIFTVAIFALGIVQMLIQLSFHRRFQELF